MPSTPSDHNPEGQFSFDVDALKKIEEYAQIRYREGHSKEFEKLEEYQDIYPETRYLSEPPEFKSLKEVLSRKKQYINQITAGPITEITFDGKDLATYTLSSETFAASGELVIDLVPTPPIPPVSGYNKGMNTPDDRYEICKYYDDKYRETGTVGYLKFIPTFADRVWYFSPSHDSAVHMMKWEVEPYPTEIILIPEAHLIDMKQIGNSTESKMAFHTKESDAEAIARFLAEQNQSILDDVEQMLKLYTLGDPLQYAAGVDAQYEVAVKNEQNWILRCQSCASFTCHHIRNAYRSGYDVVAWSITNAMSGIADSSMILCLPIFDHVFHRVGVTYSVAQDWEGNDRSIITVEPRCTELTSRSFDLDTDVSEMNNPASIDQDYMHKVILDLQGTVTSHTELYNTIFRMAQGFPYQNVCSNSKHNMSSNKYLLSYLTGREHPNGVVESERDFRVKACVFTVVNYGLCYHCYRTIDTSAFNEINI